MAEVVVDGVKLHVITMGEGPPVLFLHGLVMDNLSSWYFTAGARAASSNRVVLVDLRGHGASERPAGGYDPDTIVADLIGVLDAVGVAGPVRVVGNSFGGQLAVLMTVRHPERVAGVCLIDAHLGREGWGRDMVATLSLEGEDRDRQIAESFSTWLGRHSARKRTRLAEAASALVYGTTLRQDLRDAAPIADAAVAAIGCPVLALYGERSDLIGEATRLAGLLPHADVVVVPGATHSLMWEATETVVSSVLSWLERTPCG